MLTFWFAKTDLIWARRERGQRVRHGNAGNSICCHGFGGGAVIHRENDNAVAAYLSRAGDLGRGCSALGPIDIQDSQVV
jgi:hypothetical protein